MPGITELSMHNSKHTQMVTENQSDFILVHSSTPRWTISHRSVNTLPSLRRLRSYAHTSYTKSSLYKKTMHRFIGFSLLNDTSGRCIRWRIWLAEFEFEVKYNKRKANTQPYALSSLNTMRETTHHVDSDDIPVMFILENWAVMTRRCSFLGDVHINRLSLLMYNGLEGSFSGNSWSLVTLFVNFNRFRA